MVLCLMFDNRGITVIDLRTKMLLGNTFLLWNKPNKPKTSSDKE